MIIVSAIASSAALEPVALAQGSYQTSALGGRSALLGGTGVVLGSDGAAPFLNPATMTRIEDSSLAFSSKFFRFSRRSVDRWQQPGPVDTARFGDIRLGDTGSTQDDLATVPDSTCFFIDRGPKGVTARAGPRVPGTHKFAFCIGKVEESGFSVSAEPFSATSGELRVSRSRSLHDSWSRWSAGPSWSYNINDKISVGASIHVARAAYNQSLSVATIFEDTGAGMADSSMYQSAISGASWEMLAHLGVTYRVSDVLALGLSLRTPSVHLTDNFSATYSAGDVLGGASGGTRAWAGEGSFIARSPTRLAVGIAAEWSRIRLELDGFFYPGMDELARADLDREEVSLSGSGEVKRLRSPLSLIQEANPVVNVGGGAEMFMSPKFSLLLGVLTNLSALPAFKGSIEGGSRLFYDRKSSVHASMGFGFYTEYGDLITGIRMDYGAGQMAAVNAFVSPVRLEPVYYSEIGGMLVLAGRINLRTLARAASAVGEAVDGAPNAKPMERPTEPMRSPTRKE